MKEERHAAVMEAARHTHEVFTLALPAEGVGVILAALRLFVIHPDYLDLCLGMRAVVVHHRNNCRRLMMEMGFTRKEVDYLDAEERPIVSGGEELIALSRARMVDVYQRQVGEWFRLEVDPVGVSVIHGAVILMEAHPQHAARSQPYADLLRAIRDLLCACYVQMGFTSEEAHYMDSEFEGGKAALRIRSAKPIYYTMARVEI